MAVEKVTCIILVRRWPISMDIERALPANMIQAQRDILVPIPMNALIRKAYSYRLVKSLGI